MYHYCLESLKLFNNEDILSAINHILENGTEGDEQLKIHQQGGFDELKLYLINNVDYLKKE